MTVFYNHKLFRLFAGLYFALFMIFVPGCDRDSGKKAADARKSDPKATKIADAVLVASGGRENWDKCRYLAWNYYGKRLHVWNKMTGDARIESRGSTILMNLKTRRGRAWRNGEELTAPEDLKRALDYGYESWRTDSDWIFMPFKLHDPGVLLQYVGEGDEEGRKTDIVSVIFTRGGKTPPEKFHIHVDRDSNLLVRMTLFRDANDERPSYTAPWKDYQKYGNLLLSADRGEKKHTEVGVFEKLPEQVFRNPAPFTWAEIDSLNQLKG